MTETAGSSSTKCSLDGYGSGRSSNTIDFESPDHIYKLQLSLPEGTTAFPDPTMKAGVFLYDANDSKKEWGAGSTGAPGSGTAMRAADNKSGSVDLDMTDASPPGSPALPPLHVSGTWTC